MAELTMQASRIRRCIAVLGLITLVIAVVIVTNLDSQHIQSSDSIELLRSNFCVETPIDTDSSWLQYREDWNGEILINTRLLAKNTVFTTEYQLRMISKGSHPLSLKHQYLHTRSQRLEKYCNAFPSVNQGRYHFGLGYYTVLFNDRVELLQCMVQKASSSTWVWMFIELVGGKVEKDKAIPESHPVWNTISLSKNCNDTKRMAQRYQTYTKFLITRHPFERLFSAYTDKFTKGQEWYENKFAPAIIITNYLIHLKQGVVREVREELKRGENISNTELDRKTVQQIKRLDAGAGNYKITFSEFLNYIITQIREHGRKSLDYHWAPITVVCDPCVIRYDVIAKFETLYEDSQSILDYVQGNSSFPRVSFPKSNPKITEDRCNEAFKDIPLEVRNSLYQSYKEDFVLFDYQYYGKNSNKKYC